MSTPRYGGILPCEIAHVSCSQMVRMKQYLESKLVSRALVVDHDIKRQWEKWYDDTNLKLYDFWQENGVGEEAPKVSDGCANAYGNFMCSNLLPNCTYMPLARWPYQEMYEKIYTCKEVCQAVETMCDESWLPHKLRCDDYISIQADLSVDPKLEMSAYERRDAGGHACASQQMTVKFVSAAHPVRPYLASLLVTVLVSAYISITT